MFSCLKTSIERDFIAETVTQLGNGCTG